MGCPRQIIPGPLLHRSHAARASPTSTARVALPAAFQMHPKSTGPRVVRTLEGLHPKSGHAQNPRTIAPRSHASSLVGSTSRENDTGWSGAKRDQHCRRPGRRADRPLIRGPRRRPGITSIAVGAIARFVQCEEVNSFAHARNEAAFLVLPLVCAFTDRACPESSATAGDHE